MNFIVKHGKFRQKYKLRCAALEKFERIAGVKADTLIERLYPDGTVNRENINALEYKVGQEVATFKAR